MFDLSAQYKIEILVNDKPVSEYPHVDGYTYVEGREGSEYSLRLTNLSMERVCFVVAVDGLSVLTGDTDWTNGVIVNGGASTVVKGWRVSNSATAKFVFDDLRKSYSSRSGNGTGNTGVIGAMVFREKQQIQNHPMLFAVDNFANTQVFGGTPASLNAVSSVRGIAKSADIGTGWGDQVTSQYQEVTFERRDQNNPDALLTLYYDSAKGLDKRGVVRPENISKYNPFPFPGHGTSALRGCKPPK